jgi:hypothetical protein
VRVPQRTTNSPASRTGERDRSSPPPSDERFVSAVIAVIRRALEVCTFVLGHGQARGISAIDGGEIAGTQPGRVTWDGALIIRVLAWGIVPLLGVAAIQYPEAANRLLRIIAPFVRALE